MSSVTAPLARDSTRSPLNSGTAAVSEVSIVSMAASSTTTRRTSASVRIHCACSGEEVS